jgi:serine/threonine-protein kinase
MAATSAVPAYESTTVVPVEELPPAEPRKRSWPFIVVLILLLLGLAGLLFALSRLLSNGSKTDTVSLKVPAGCCVNKPEPQARAALEGAGFNVTEELQKNDLMPTGNVITVDPAEGTSIDVPKNQKGSAKLIVSSGANTVKMPNVVGSQLDQATNTLKAAGFGNISSQQAPSDDPSVQVGEVTQQNPASGSDVPKSQAVTLTVSSGKTKVKIPTDVVGQDAATAGATLGGLGLNVSTDSRSDANVPSGKVIGTNPPPGTQVDKGSSVTIVVSTGPPPTSSSSSSNSGSTSSASS